MKTYIGIDNGVSGTIAIIKNNGVDVYFDKMPVKSEQSYTKAKQNITRIDYGQLLAIFLREIGETDIQYSRCFALIERPMVNPGRFKASASALRSLEAVMIALEWLNIPYSFIDSRNWQKVLLPQGLEKEELKKASLDIGKRLFPTIELKHPDRDGLLIAEYARRMNL